MPTFDVSYGNILWWLSTSAPEIAVGVASYRRSRCLSRYPVWRSVIIGFLAGSFTALWLVVWWVNRKRIAQEWEYYRRDRTGSNSVVLT